MLEISESDHVAKHRPVRVEPGRVAIENNAPQVLRLEFLSERVGGGLRHGVLQNDVRPVAAQFLDQFVRWQLQHLGQERN